MHANNQIANASCSACALPGCSERQSEKGQSEEGPGPLASVVLQETHDTRFSGSVESEIVDSGTAPDLGGIGPYWGWQFACVSFGIFALPVFLAVYGAVLGTGSLVGQLVGASIGLGIGMGGTMMVARCFSCPQSDIL